MHMTMGKTLDKGESDNMNNNQRGHQKTAKGIGIYLKCGLPRSFNSPRQLRDTSARLRSGSPALMCVQKWIQFT